RRGGPRGPPRASALHPQGWQTSRSLSASPPPFARACPRSTIPAPPPACALTRTFTRAEHADDENGGEYFTTGAGPTRVPPRATSASSRSAALVRSDSFLDRRLGFDSVYFWMAAGVHDGRGSIRLKHTPTRNVHTPGSASPSQLGSPSWQTMLGPTVS